MGLILGLDVSTSCVGLCLLRDDSQIVLLDRIEFKKCKTLWEKADVAKLALESLKQRGTIERVYVEEALLGFRPGLSSAQTISTLLRFNGIVSFIARATFGIDPEYIASNHARKVCGIKLLKTAIGGPQKEQVFKHMSEHDLKGVEWPLTKAGKVVPWSRDATDAYVVARAGAIDVQVPVVCPVPTCAFPDCDKKRMKNLSMCRKHQPFPAG